jgi:hypothetical protein
MPQLVRSVSRSRQAPLQSVVPAAQEIWQAPLTQRLPGAQARPHAPQLALSVSRSRQAPEQLV